MCHSLLLRSSVKSVPIQSGIKVLTGPGRVFRSESGTQAGSQRIKDALYAFISECPWTVCSGIILLPYFSCFPWYPNESWGALCILDKFHQKEWRLQIKSVRAVMWRKGIKYIAIINELAWQMEHWMWYSLTFSEVCNTSPSDIFINKVDKYVLRKNIARWTHVVVVNCFWRKCHLFTAHHKEISGEILQKSVLDLNLFDAFINRSGDGVRNRMHSADKSGLE